MRLTTIRLIEDEIQRQIHLEQSFTAFDIWHYLLVDYPHIEVREVSVVLKRHWESSGLKGYVAVPTIKYIPEWQRKVQVIEYMPVGETPKTTYRKETRGKIVCGSDGRLCVPSQTVKDAQLYNRRVAVVVGNKELSLSNSTTKGDFYYNADKNGRLRVGARPTKIAFPSVSPGQIFEHETSPGSIRIFSTEQGLCLLQQNQRKKHFQN